VARASGAKAIQPLPTTSSVVMAISMPGTP
jgi:hypothetical protein